MKPFTFILCLFLCSCSWHGEKKSATEKKLSKTYLLQKGVINKLVAANHKKLVGTPGNFASFKIYLAGLSDVQAESIPFALDYIKTFLPATITERDSVFWLFNVKFYAVSNRLSDSLETRYHIVVDQLNKNAKTAQLANFRTNLKDCGIGIFSTEGEYYLDVEPDYFYANFKGRTSAGVKEFLAIRKDELKEGFSEDAGLLISFDKVYQRVKRWERFLHNYPNTLYSLEANSYYVTYLETLLTGMDNSRVFDGPDDTLLPEVKNIYEDAKNEMPQSATSSVISAYYTFLKRHQFKYNDSVNVFLKEQKLSTMLAVQPHTR